MNSPFEFIPGHALPKEIINRSLKFIDSSSVYKGSKYAFNRKDFITDRMFFFFCNPVLQLVFYQCRKMPIPISSSKLCLYRYRSWQLPCKLCTLSVSHEWLHLKYFITYCSIRVSWSFQCKHILQFNMHLLCLNAISSCILGVIKIWLKISSLN